MEANKSITYEIGSCMQGNINHAVPLPPSLSHPRSVTARKQGEKIDQLPDWLMHDGTLMHGRKQIHRDPGGHGYLSS